MEIEEKLYFFLQGLKLLEVVDQSSDFWIQKVANLAETPIKVPTTEASPIIPSDYSIRIDHGNDVKVEFQE